MTILLDSGQFDADGYRYKIELPVRFRDLDARQHVNNAVYLTYFETVRLAFWSDFTGSAELQEREMIVAEITCTYRSPAYFNEALAIWIKPAAIRRTSFILHYRITAQETGRLIATGRSVQVAYNYQTNGAIPVWPELRAALERVAGRPLDAEERL